MHPIKRYRIDNKLTQRQLARKLDVTNITVYRWETGSRKIAVDILPRVARKTGIPESRLRPDLAELIGGNS